MPDVGDLRLWHRPRWKVAVFDVAVKNVAEAVQTSLLLTAFCRYLLGSPRDTRCGLEEWDGGGWVVYRDADGKAFSDYLGEDVR